jgi:hypothetical protein
MAVSYENSKVIFQGIKAAGIRSLSALPETWLGLLLQQAERDPDVTLIQVAKEEEAIGVAAGAYFAGTPHILLMQNHGFLAAINGIVSLAQLYNMEHHPDGGAHRRALRRARSLDHRQGSARERVRHDPGRPLHRACVRH